MTGRIVIEDIRPRTPTGFPAKASVGERVEVTASIFSDGHDILAAQVRLVRAGQAPGVGSAAVGPTGSVLISRGNDVWVGAVIPPEVGAFALLVEAWTDRHATWAHKVEAKLAVGADVSVEVAEALLLIEERGAGDPALATALAALKDTGKTPKQRVTPALADAVGEALAGPERAPDLTVAPLAPLWVDRERALVGAWYELFPRSYGGLRGTARRVPDIAAMGFDVLYLPPIHPIGTSFRKGANNSLITTAGDPGSPWAIGSAEGGHTAIDPGLGDFEDFDALVASLRTYGMEVALDYALQCSPDHPWVSEHPEWFHHRPDGSIAYAENPPKRYQDIYPINFWPEQEVDRVRLWDACRDILDFWIARGVRIFRVDNPHTKPIAFWEWLIPAIQSRHPDVVFLAEAFTRPKVMAKLAEIGFTQSYTYFTWRTVAGGPEGLRTYLEELAHSPSADFMRPNFWPSTPDILSGDLRNGPPAAFALRYVLAATMSPSYGVFSGYELYENEPASPDNEEYLNSEKYEVKVRDFSGPGTLAPLITAVNRIRRRHPAFSRLRTITFHDSDNPAIIAYSKVDDSGEDIVLVIVTLDPGRAQETIVHLDLDALGLPSDRPFGVYDELSGETYEWRGPDAFVRLEPWTRVAHILTPRPRAQP